MKNSMYIQQHFRLKHVAKYFRTRSPVSVALFTPPTYKNTQADFFSRLRNRQTLTVLLELYTVVDMQAEAACCCA
jgi:hypothetical protein